MGIINAHINEIIFSVTEEPDGGYIASALGESIVTEADSLPELHRNLRDAVLCHFEGRDSAPKVIPLHFVRQEAISL